MQLNRVHIKNFLSITDVDLKPGQVTMITGPNNQGKTTILRAIEAALKGSTEGSMVRHGADMAEILLEFDNDMTVHRKIRKDGKQGVQVKKGEMSADKPQTMLDGLMQGLTFNPLDLLDPKMRADALLRSIDIRVTEADVVEQLRGLPVVSLPPVAYEQHGLKVAEQVHRYFFQRRAEANKVAKDKADVFKVKTGELPPVNEAKLLAAKNASSEDVVRNGIGQLEQQMKFELQKKAAYDGAVGSQAECAALLQKAELRVITLQSELNTAKAQVELRTEDVAKAKVKVQESTPNLEVIADISAKIRGHNETLAAFAYMREISAQIHALDDVGKAMDEAKKFAADMDRIVDAVGPQFKAKLMQRAELPVKGLEYRDGEFYLDGSSIDNLSSSAALRLAVAVARRIANKTKLICIDGAELLDEKSFAELRVEIEGDGYSYFITKVGLPFNKTNPGDLVLSMDHGAATQLNAGSEMQ